jgi:homoaconitase/3-isopropylmalate dehydratase large subunit
MLREIGMDGGLGKIFLLEGSTVDSLGICSRRQLCNLMVEAGAIGSFMRPDGIVASHLGINESAFPRSGALECDESLGFDLSGIEPQVALPGRPDDVHPVEELDNVKVDAVFIGSCAGGSIEDLRALDEILKVGDISEDVRLIVVPQSAGTLLEAERLGIIGRIANKGAYISGPGCGPCMGAHLGVLGRGEVCVSTSPRNFPGRMGSRKAKIYLANAWVAAAAAVTGRIVHPRRVIAG